MVQDILKSHLIDFGFTILRLTKGGAFCQSWHGCRYQVYTVELSVILTLTIKDECLIVDWLPYEGPAFKYDESERDTPLPLSDPEFYEKFYWQMERMKNTFPRIVPDLDF